MVRVKPSGANSGFCGTRLSLDSLRDYCVGLVGLVLVLSLWQRVDTIYNEPPVWMLVLSIVALVLWNRNVPLTLLLFWLAGLVTLVWSLGPGNTIVAFLWESLLVVAFLAGYMPVAAVVGLVLLSLDGYLNVVALASFGMQSYLSGSIGYVAGAIGAATAVLGVAIAARVGTIGVGRVLAAICGVVGLTLALASGSRAVYLGLATGIVLVLGRQVFVRQWSTLRLTGLAIVSILVVVLMLEHIGGYTVITPAWQAKATVDQTVAAVESHGILTQRLRFWHQGLNTALEYPFGTGIGTYPATTHAFQQYPMLWSSSPHNYLVQVLATGGWLRLALVLLLLVACLRVGFRETAWPWTCAATALGVTTLFDVTGGYPKVMVLTFMLHGAGYFQGKRYEFETERVGRTGNRLALVLQRGGVLALATTIAWWYWPCSGDMCVVDRYLGMDQKVLPVLARADETERAELFQRLRELYPRSLWVLQAELAYTTDASARLTLEREIAETYPLQHPDNYLAWAKSAAEAGDGPQAARALKAGLVVFPRDAYPYGEMRMTPQGYAAWVDEAEALLKELSGPR